MAEGDSAIRTWAKENGHEVGERGRIPNEVREAFERSLDEQPRDDFDDWAAKEGLDAPLAPLPAERKPKVPGLAERVKGIAKSKVTSKKRVPAEDMLGGAWQLVGSGLVMSGADIPVGRVMSLQAPTAGAVLDKAVAGTFIDVLAVQPIARAGSKGISIGALIGPPLLVGLIERNFALYEPLKPILKMMLSAYLVDMAPQLKEMRKKEQAAMDALAEVMEELGGEPGVQVDLDMILGSFFEFPGQPVLVDNEEEIESV